MVHPERLHRGMNTRRGREGISLALIFHIRVLLAILPAVAVDLRESALGSRLPFEREFGNLRTWNLRIVSALRDDQPGWSNKDASDDHGAISRATFLLGSHVYHVRASSRFVRRSRGYRLPDFLIELGHGLAVFRVFPAPPPAREDRLSRTSSPIHCRDCGETTRS